MFHLQNIPRIAHFYWGGGRLSYLRYLTLETFHYYNPEWEIRFYYPKNPIRGHSWVGKEQKYVNNWEDWFPMLNADWVKIIEVPWDKPFFKDMSEVHRSDYYRLMLLSTVGGLWIDMDILFFRSVDALAINIPQNKRVKTVMCIFSYGHSIGFMMASENNVAFKRIEIEAFKMYDAKNYQCIGAEAYNKVFPTIQSVPDSVELGMEAVYFYNCTQIKYIFGQAPILPQDNPHCIGVHWYAGSLAAGDYLYKTKGGENPDDSLIGNLIREYERNFHADIQD